MTTIEAVSIVFALGVSGFAYLAGYSDGYWDGWSRFRPRF